MTKEQEERFLEYCNLLSYDELLQLHDYLLFRILIKRLAKCLVNKPKD